MLKGEYGAGIGWGARFENGEFSTKVKNNSATVQLESGWGGKVTVTISLRAGKLYWKVIKSEEENYFPREMILHRAKYSGLHMNGESAPSRSRYSTARVSKRSLHPSAICCKLPTSSGSQPNQGTAHLERFEREK